MARFSIIAVTAEGYQREIYTASERQVHANDPNMTAGTIGRESGLWLDPSDYPEAEKFLVVLQENQ